MRSMLPAVILLINGCAFEVSDRIDADHAESMSESIHHDKDKYQKAYDSTLLLWPVPYDELMVPTTYGNAHIITSGNFDSPPVVLLHGMNSSSTMWYPNIGVISETHRIYAIDDITEPGRSEMLHPLDNIDDLINWYIEILDNLGLEKITLIGASKGGWLAMKLALKNPYRVEKLVLLSPLQTFSNIPRDLKFLNALMYAINPSRNGLDNVLKSMSTNTSNIDPRYIEQFLLGSKIAENPSIIFKFKPFSRKELNRLDMPVLILIGDNDIINKKTVVEKASEALRSVKTSIIPDAGHFLSMDQIEITNNKISEFINSTDVASANGNL